MSLGIDVIFKNRRLTVKYFSSKIVVLFYDLLGFKADPTKVSNKSYIASRDPTVESLPPLATNEIWDETIWRRKVRNIFAKKISPEFSYERVFFKPLYSEKLILQKNCAKVAAESLQFQQLQK